MACRRMRGAAVSCALAALTAGCTRGTGAVPAAPELRDLNVAVVPSPDSAGFFIVLHEGLFARQGLHGQGQQLAGTSRAAAGQATGALPAPPGLIPDIAALISPDSYPAGPAGAVRIQRAADVMRQFPGASRFNVTSMLSGIHDGHALAFPYCAARRRSLGKGGFMGTVWG